MTLPQPKKLPPLPFRGLEGALQSLAPHLAREIRDYMRSYAHQQVDIALAQRDAEIAELKQTIGILAEEKEADIRRANSAESNLSAAKELLHRARRCCKVGVLIDEIDAFLQEKK